LLLVVALLIGNGALSNLEQMRGDGLALRGLKGQFPQLKIVAYTTLGGG
jgi:hypothetical protein